jgi:hypothetical protein
MKLKKSTKIDTKKDLSQLGFIRQTHDSSHDTRITS